ncbi:hypothetical protein KAI87_09365, partial [Myxococcota bacterium]|nr:hypothetical protein [Myxococcota bacterium]
MLIGPPVLILLLANCASFNRSLDRSGLEDKVEVAISTPDAGTLPAPLPFTDEVSLEELTRAAP